MLKSLILTAGLLSLSAPAWAQTLEKPDCSKTNIESIEEKVVKMKDGRNKQTASSEIATAKDMLAKGQIDDCQTALLKATVQTK
jgi:predicted Zn-dependent peptidase